MRSNFTRPFLAAAALAVSVAALYGFLVLPLPRWRAWVVTLFGLGVILSCVAGWLAGRGLMGIIRRRRVFNVLIVADAVVSAGIVFAFLCSFAGHPIIDHPLAEAVVTAVAVILVVANSYAVGHLLLSRRASIRRGRCWTAVVLLYGSILAGIAVYRWNPPPWETVPVVPLNADTRKPVAELLAEAREERQPDENPVRITDDGITIRSGPWGHDLGRAILYDEVVNAGGPRAELGNGSVEILGMELRTEESSVLKKAGGNRLWRLDGSPLPGDALPGTEASRLAAPVELVFHVRVNAEFGVATDLVHELVLMPWQSPVGYQLLHEPVQTATAETHDTLRLRFVLQLPVPGPLELRLLAVGEDEIAYTLPNEPGARVDLEKNAIELAGVVAGCFQEGVTDFDTLWWPPIVLTPRRDSESGGMTTAIFRTVLFPDRYASGWRRWPEGFSDYPGRPPDDHPVVPGFRAVLKDGGTVEPASLRFRSRFAHVEYNCSPEDIESFSIIERPRITEVRFPIENLPFIPEENRRLENLLDLRVPYPVRDYVELMKTLFGPRSTYAVLYAGTRHPFPKPGANPSLRQLLNAYYPGRWMVKEGRISDRERVNIRRRLQEAFEHE